MPGTFGDDTFGAGTFGGLSVPAGPHSVGCTVEVAFTTDPLSEPSSWTDISEFVRRISTRRGRNHELGKTSTGVATLTLDNRDRRFDPTNVVGPYYPNVKPMRHVRILLIWGLVPYPIFRGYVEDWGQQWGGPAAAGKGDATCEVQISDGFKVLALMEVMAYRDAVLTDQPALYFPMDEPAGSISGANLGDAGDVLTYFPIPGAGSTTPGARADGPFASTADQVAVDFRDPTDAGAPAYLPAADVTLQASPLTIEFWIRPDTLSGTPNYIVSQAGDYWHVITSATGQVSFEYVANRTHGVGFTGVGSTANLTPAGQTHHIAVVRDIDSIAFYQDGVLSQIYDGYADPVAIPGSAFGLNKIGSSFDGILAHLAIYPTALTADQVAVHYAAACERIDTLPSGDAIDDILNCVGWPIGLRNLATGLSTVTITPNGSALDAIQQIGEDTEHGILDINPDGMVLFIGRDRFETPQVSQATFGDGGGSEVPYRDLVLAYDDQDLWTEVHVSGVAGEAIAQDDAAMMAYGTRTLDISTVAATAEELPGQAQGLLNRYKAPAVRPTSITFMGPRSIAQQLSRAIGDRVTLKRRPPGTGTSLSPMSLSGLAAWYDFSDISTLWTNQARTTPVTADGDGIRGVTDKSGNGNHLIDGSIGFPTYKVSAIGGLPGVRFVGASSQAFASTTFALTQPFSVFLVGKVDAAPDGWYFDGAVQASTVLYAEDATNFSVWAGINLQHPVSSGANLNPHILGAVFDGASSKALFDGDAILGNAGTANTGTGIRVGASGGGGSYLTGYISEMVICTGAMSAGDQATLDTYWGDRYGITVADAVPVYDPVITIDALIEGINHDVGPEGWPTTTFALAPPDLSAYWVLGDAVSSVLGSTTIPGW